MSIDIRFNRVDKVYAPNESITGSIIVNTPSELYHSGISLVCEGTVNLQLSARSVGLFEAFYSSLKPITLVNINLNVVPNGNIQAGGKEFPFDFKLKSYDGNHWGMSCPTQKINIKINKRLVFSENIFMVIGIDIFMDQAK